MSGMALEDWTRGWRPTSWHRVAAALEPVLPTLTTRTIARSQTMAYRQLGPCGPEETGRRGHAATGGSTAGGDPGPPGSAPGALPAPGRRPAGDDGRRGPSCGADLPRRGEDDPLLPGVSRVPADRAVRESRLSRVQPPLLRHRQPQSAPLLRLPRP